MQTGAKAKINIRPMMDSDFLTLEKLVHAAYRGGEAAVSWKNEHDIVSGPRITHSGLKDLLESQDALVLVAERLDDGYQMDDSDSLGLNRDVLNGITTGATHKSQSPEAMNPLLSPPQLEASNLCGCVLIEREVGRAHGITVVIGMLAVSPTAQNLGLGRMLVDAAEQAAIRQFHATVAHMHVASVRSELLAWYARLGYIATGDMKPFPGPEAGVQALLQDLQFAVVEKKL